ncbi:Na+-dependent transporter [Undibacter mobilis]|uniref:Na+-dependent transporter n=1 Tax=Undibacter mobilis TaxID=2292256 RepID=A0A371BCE8_9BRAD|nr:Na+-dependent transporter [Undibacter mobilis]RDV05266.1 Na+-dependent transporter [Undibacter mobilis]
MTYSRWPLAALAWLGRQGTTALALSIFLGVAVPQLAAYVKPYLGETVFVLLLFSYLRTDPEALRPVLRSPRLIVLAALWVMVAVPLFLGSFYTLIGLRDIAPDLFPIMILQSAIAPITSTVAFAALMSLDVGFSLVALIACCALSPLTTVAFSYLFLGTSLFTPLELGGKLFVLFFASGFIAFIIRRTVGQRRIEEQTQVLDGLNVIAVFVFAIAAMEPVTRHVMADPLLALKLLGVIVAIACAVIGLSAILFIRAGLDRAIVIGFLAGFRNLGAVIGALGSALPDLAWFYFALVQFPIYIFPALLKPLAKRLPKRQP